MTSVEEIKKAAEDIKQAADEGIHTVARGMLQSAALAQSVAKEQYTSALNVLDEGKVYVHQGLSFYKAAEDIFFEQLKYGVELGIANPYVAYPAAGLAGLLVLPITRRLLYRATIGRFKSQESVARACEARVAGLKTRIEDYSSQVNKLQERMKLADEEMRAGMAKLKATRLEMQRLSGTLASSERVAQSVLQDLRLVSPKVKGVLQVRGEAAGQASALRAHRTKIDKAINKIIGKDI